MPHLKHHAMLEQEEPTVDQEELTLNNMILQDFHSSSHQPTDGI